MYSSFYSILLMELYFSLYNIMFTLLLIIVRVRLSAIWPVQTVQLLYL